MYFEWAPLWLVRYCDACQFHMRYKPCTSLWLLLLNPSILFYRCLKEKSDVFPHVVAVLVLFFPFAFLFPPGISFLPPEQMSLTVPIAWVCCCWIFSAFVCLKEPLLHLRFWQMLFLDIEFYLDTFPQSFKNAVIVFSCSRFHIFS